MDLKHKWVYLALAVLVASIGAHETPLFLLLLFPIVLHAHYKKFHPFLMAAILLSGIASFGYFSSLLNEIEKPAVLPGFYAWTADYKINGDLVKGFMKDENGRKVYVKYQLRSEQEKRRFEEMPLAGRKFLIDGEWEEPKRPHHAYSFDMNDYLKSHGVMGIVKVESMQYVGSAGSLHQFINQMRFSLEKHIEETFPSSLAPEAEALLIGLQEDVEDETKRAYQKLGITHLFAISGLHIAVLSWIVFESLIRLRIRRELAAILLMSLLPGYAILAGGAPSVWRAVAVAELLMISRWKRRLAVDDALAISFIGFVLLEPWAIYQIGFQLSFLATAGLVYSSNFLQTQKSWWAKSFYVTFFSQIIVYPLLLYHFYELSISSLFANLIYVPLFSFAILPTNIVLLFLSFLPDPVSRCFFELYEPLRMMIAKMTFFLQSLPYQLWMPGKPSLLLMGICYISIFIALYLLDCRANWRAVVPVLCIPLLLLYFQGKVNPHLVINFVDVGQGDCIVIELPYRRKVYVIDSGGVLRFGQEEWKQREPFEVGKQIVVPFLKGKGISKIDVFILSHADSDHVEGAEEILEEIRAEEIHVSPSSLSEPVMKELLDVAKKQRVPIKEQIAGYSWKDGDVYFQYLWPQDAEYEGNNDSLVLYMKKGGFDAMFTGDLEAEGERKLIALYPTLPELDLLKAGHHGSRTSSSEEFVERFRPALTIFSAGENNRFGHPHKEVVERFHQYGLKTMTTGDAGTIEITVKNQTMRVTSSNKQE
ncbi:DNA internalization-related competence protein ComEC/Rec2 [Ureibacillus terrenus]|uniref:DNA internalization-related competence protein ComEC/Rec2 n=1 Tax=Ureibacillus terrenus TaxID=118246 RepID=UPI002E231E08|nr:DNA internalization-related competence protein ComEC/Rec2 [Ureibacillus terrenus]